MARRKAPVARTGAGSLLAALALALGPAASSAPADQEVVAGPGTRYLTTSVTIDQGERLTFSNVDSTGHDVTANATGPDGGALFGTPVIGTGSSAFVEGSQYLVTGRYDFHCSVHAFMHGTLTVTSAGKPATRPAGDSRAPGVAVEILSRRLRSIARSGRLRVSFHTDEDATVELRGRERARRRTFALRKATRTVKRDTPTRLSLRLTRRARRALRHAKRARFSVFAVTRDRAGNRGSGAARRTLKR